jgi:aspartate aminotransferase
VAEQTVTLNGFAKGFAMTGWRLGYMGAPKDIAIACSKIQGQITSGASSFGQYAASVALSSDLQPTWDMVKAFEVRRNILIDLLKDVKGLKINKPGGAFYLFPDVSELFGKRNGEDIINTANDLCDYLLNVAHVATVSGEGFGDANCIRISYAASEANIREAMRRIIDAVGKLRFAFTD